MTPSSPTWTGKNSNQSSKYFSVLVLQGYDNNLFLLWNNRLDTVTSTVKRCGDIEFRFAVYDSFPDKDN